MGQKKAGWQIQLSRKICDWWSPMETLRITIRLANLRMLMFAKWWVFAMQLFVKPTMRQGSHPAAIFLYNRNEVEFLLHHARVGELHLDGIAETGRLCNTWCCTRGVAARRLGICLYGLRYLHQESTITSAFVGTTNRISLGTMPTGCACCSSPLIFNRQNQYGT